MGASSSSERNDRSDRISFLGIVPRVAPALRDMVLQENRRNLSLERFPFDLTSDALLADYNAYNIVTIIGRITKDLSFEKGSKTRGFDIASFHWGAGLGYSLAHRAHEEAQRELCKLCAEYKSLISESDKEGSKDDNSSNYNSQRAIELTNPTKPIEPLSDRERFLTKLLSKRQ